MVKTCKETDCNTIPNFGYKEDRIALFCAAHKSPDMINVKSKTCQKTDCETQSNFGYKEDGIAL